MPDPKDEAMIEELRNIDTRPGRNAGGPIDPTKAYPPAIPTSANVIEGMRDALQFYATEWRGNAEGDPSTPGLLRTWMEPTDKLFEDEGAKAREVLAALALPDSKPDNRGGA